MRLFTNRNISLFLFGTFILFCACKPNSEVKEKEDSGIKEFSVLAWNILHGANEPWLNEDGRPHAINIIKTLDPDIVLMVETYGSGKMIADSLGYHFHLIAPENTPLDDKHINLSIMSRFPMGERFDFYNPFNIGGIEIFINDKIQVNAFATWLNYQPWADDPLLLNKSPEQLIQWEKSGTREDEVQTILEGLQPFLQQSAEIPLILGGDFNIWSHLDWKEETSTIHDGLIVEWWTTSMFEKAGMIDSYREVNPNALEYPGITWDQPGIKDEHRIDYIFYKGLKIKAIQSIIEKEDTNNFIQINGEQFLFPSDHGLVFTTFQLNL